MSPELLRLHCRRDIARSRIYSAILPTACRFSISGNYIAAWALGIGGVVSLNVGLFFLAVAAYHALGAATRSPWLRPASARGLSDLDDVTDDLEPEDRDFIAQLLDEVGFDLSAVRALSVADETRTAPSITSAYGSYYLLLPSRFFSLWQAEPKIARAMLAHEVGHLAQQDVNAYVEFRRYMRFIARRFLPALLAITAMACAIALYVIPDLLSRSTVSIVDIGLGVDFDYARGRATRAGAIAFAASIAVVCLIVTCASALLLTLLFRAMNFRSEAICDRIAMTLTGGDSILHAVRFFHSDSNAQDFFTPPLRWREQKILRVLSKLAQAPKGSEASHGHRAANGLVPREDDFPRTGARWALFRFLAWTLVGGAAVSAANAILATTPFGLAAPATTLLARLPVGEFLATMSGDGRRVATFNPWSQRVEVTSHPGGEVVGSLSAPQSPRKLRISSTGRFVVAIADWPEEEPRFADLESPSPEWRPLSTEAGSLEATFRSIDRAEYLWTAGRGGRISVYQMPSDLQSAQARPTLVRELATEKDLSAVAVRVDGQYLATAASRGTWLFPRSDLAVWDLNGRSISIHSVPVGGIDQISLSHDGRYLGLRGEPEYLLTKGMVLDLTTGQMLGSPDDARMAGVEWAPHANAFVAEHGLTSDGTQGQWSIFSPSGKTESSERWGRIPFALSIGSPEEVQWSRDGLIVFARNQTRAQLASVRNRSIVRELRSSAIAQFVPASGGRHGISRHTDDVVRLWALHDTEPYITLVREVPMPGIRCVAANSDRLMAVMHGRAVVFEGPHFLPSVEQSNLACEQPEQSDRFAIAPREIMDRQLGWRISTDFVNSHAAVLRAPGAEHVNDPEYVVLTTDVEKFLVHRIGTDGRKKELFYWVVFAIVLSWLAGEGLLYIRRRHLNPF